MDKVLDTLSFTELSHFRKILHQYPEVSNQEHNTAQRVVEFLKKYQPTQLLEQIGGTGVVATFEGANQGKHVLIRCELDALPIAEVNEFEHKSTQDGVGHKCGHDGHMTMVAALAPLLQGLPRGKVSLLFQPAEETGEGALQMLKDEKFAVVQPDYVFALHNLPSIPKHQILVKSGTICAASTGMIIRLLGKTSHAAEPQDGKSPALAMAAMIQMLDGLPQAHNFEDFTLVTVIHALLGEIAFGTTPGYAEVRATLRTFSNSDMQTLTNEAVAQARNIAQKHGLGIEIDWTDTFAATVNDKACVETIKKAAKRNGFELMEVPSPAKWSEDFGQFTERYSGALFGLGAGEEHPQLHNPDYDFPDEILPTGVAMFWEIIKEVL